MTLGAAIGDISPGAFSATGLLYLNSIKQLSGTLTRLTWAYYGVDGDVRFAVYVNGMLTVTVDGRLRSTTIPVSDFSRHSMSLAVFPRTITPPRFCDDLTDACRAYVRWNQSDDETLKAYIVTVGGTSYTLDTASIAEGTYWDGAARFTVEGRNAGTYRNAVFTATVSATRILAVANDVDATTWVRNYVPNRPCLIFDGLSITVSPEAVTNDSVQFVVGIQPEFITPQLSAGVQSITVRERDGFGNESDESSAVSVTVPAVVAPVTNPGFTVTAGNVIATGTSASTVYAYMNTDAYSEYPCLPEVNFDTPIASGTLPFTVVALASLAMGDYMLILRHSGDTSLYPLTFSVPYIPASLPAVTRLTATPIADGGVRLAWSTKTPYTSWRITGLTTDPLDVTVNPGANMTYSTDILAADIGPDGDYTATVAAYASPYSGPSSSVEFTTDGTANEAPTGVTACLF